ncbi:Response regulator protein TmoT [bacterium HR36]|nr:Response regulator protein TmoT [bacterium HR36]
MPEEGCVYVVDDDPAVGDSLRFMLGSVGLRTEVFSSAPEFLQRYNPGCPSCLVLDVRMPGMSGLELQEEMKQRGIAIPVIILTAHGEVSAAARAFKNGALDFLEKPCSDQQLLDAVNKALRTDRQWRQERQALSQIAACLERLTERERDVLRLIVAGFSSREISQRFGLQSKTVESHRMNILRKMQARNVADLVRQITQVAQSPWFPQWRFLLENLEAPSHP